jgi:DNA-binding GntR family transcriptional regulator
MTRSVKAKKTATGSDANPSLPRRVTLSSQLYQILERKVLDGELAPGTPISEDSIAESYGVSRTPAREALGELERLGLAVRTGMRDRMITIPSLSMISEKFELWWILDVGRTYLASLAATEADIQELRRFIERMRSAVQRGEPKRYQATCEKFHLRIRSRCPNSYVNQMAGECDVYLHWFELLYDRNPEFSMDVVEEHIRILSAFERKDLAELSESIRNHIQRQRNRIVGHFQIETKSLSDAPAGPGFNLVSSRRNL